MAKNALTGTSLQRQGILVTGIHRSGTTWMGKILSIPDDMVYIHEPFNPKTDTIDYQFKHWFTHMPDLPDPERLYKAMERTLRFGYVPKPPAHLSRYRAAGWMVRMQMKNLAHRMRGRKPLVKDPIALMSAEDLVNRFRFHVVCMIRHPLGFCSSLKKWNWAFQFSNFIEQPKLIETFFAAEADTIAEYAKEAKPIVLQATLLWNLCHKVIRRYQSDHLNWHFRRHEDMTLDPVVNFRELYRVLGLPFEESVESQLRDSVSGETVETGTAAYGPRRAASVKETWRKRLSREETDHILRETRELRDHFYPDEDKVFWRN